jgi:hypothetical protein
MPRDLGSNHAPNALFLLIVIVTGWTTLTRKQAGLHDYPLEGSSGALVGITACCGIGLDICGPRSGGYDASRHKPRERGRVVPVRRLHVSGFGIEPRPEHIIASDSNGVTG